MPHEETALALADEVTGRAQAIGSTNTLIFDNGQIIADNYDGVGFLKSLRQTAGTRFDPTKPVLVFGAGGASRAVLHSLLDAGVPEIRLTNRTPARAENQAERFNSLFGIKVRVVDWHKAESAMSGAGTLINTTSMGMNKNPPLPFNLDQVDDDAVVADIVEHSAANSFPCGCTDSRFIDCQRTWHAVASGAPGFEAWYGIRPSVDDAIREVMPATLNG